MLTLFAQLPGPVFWDKAIEQVPSLAVLCVSGLIIVVLFLRSIRAISADGKAVVSQFLERDAKVMEVLDRNTEALGRADALTDEVREFRRESSYNHMENRHAICNLANAAGLERALREHAQAQAHKATGGPPGTIVIETPPVTLPPTGIG